MKSFFTLFILVAFGAMQVQAQLSKESSEVESVNLDAPDFEFDDETWDFGEVDEGPKVDHEFIFTNTGKEPLILKNVKASCGCTVPTWPREPILPGEEGKILVTYNTKGRPGNFNKAITITSNASSPRKVIYIKGKVLKAPEEETIPVREPSLLSPISD